MIDIVGNKFHVGGVKIEFWRGNGGRLTPMGEGVHCGVFGDIFGSFCGDLAHREAVAILSQMIVLLSRMIVILSLMIVILSREVARLSSSVALLP